MSNNGQTSYNLWDKPKALKVASINVLHKLFLHQVSMLGTWAIVAHNSGVQSVSNLTLYTIEGTGTDEEYLLGIDLNHLLVRMLAPTLRGYIHY